MAVAGSRPMGPTKLYLTVIGSIAALAMRPRVELARDSVAVALSPAELVEVFRARFAADTESVLAIEPDRLVRRFSGTEGPFRFQTVEVVRYRENAITFEHLAGPFAECTERFDLTPTATGTRLTHSGSFRLRGGLWTAPLAKGPVKWAFENHVRTHLQALADEYGDADRIRSNPVNQGGFPRTLRCRPS